MQIPGVSAACGGSRMLLRTKPRDKMDEVLALQAVAQDGHGSKLSHQELDRRFWSMFPFSRASFWVPVCDPQPDVSQAVDWPQV